jgi:hypothetical protein
MHLIAVIDDERIADKILAHLGLPSRAARRMHRRRREAALSVEDLLRIAPSAGTHAGGRRAIGARQPGNPRVHPRRPRTLSFLCASQLCATLMQLDL